MNASIATLRRLPRASRLCATVVTGAASVLLLASAHAALRSSASYSLTTETADSGGRSAASTHYSNLGSVGGVFGVSTVVTPAQTAKAGYIAQLSAAATGLRIAATPGTINETGTRQLSAELLMDDDSAEPVPASSVTWSIVSGPLTGINASGLATADTVFQNSSASVQGFYNGSTATLGLTVLDTLSDNFGSYAADGLGDDWQIQYFGQDNPAAAPAMDPDGDGHSNRFEFTAGLVPTDRASVFTINLTIPVGQPTQRAVIFTPRLAGRTYTVKTSTTLSSWGDLTTPTVSDNGSVRTVTDVNASGSRQFYRVEISLP